MSIAKFDLYNAEWLDLVFDHRNKEYGAYDLRKNYGQTMARAMGLALAGVAILVAASIVFKHKIEPVPKVNMTPVDLKDITIQPPVEPKLKKQDPPKSVDPPAPAVPIKQTAIPTHVATENERTVDPVDISKIEGAIGPVTVDGPAKGPENVLNTNTTPGGNGPGTAPANNNVVEVGTLEVMPEPVGGAAAWGKFLQKNLRFPAVAQEQGVSGRVIMSFIIEKDGSLSNIKVERGAGYGFDEEALRVLKLAKAWKPGIQNGQPVRVRYNIPINFQLSEQ
ncbi:energy transducer TonB [Mucilaginibacter sp. OK268]|uniref:energy transducer TonB n=1 Tax=Mucilaginibacter sp. OK268 TaxID=1881048 RepID=UPI0015A4386B|nr:energy transducer TonB [Mucilaginibacter sp. OK268]